MTTAAELFEIKARSEAWLRARGLKVNLNLPVLEASALRPGAELVARAAALNALSEVGEGAPPSLVRRWLEKNQLTGSLAEAEVTLLAKPMLEPLDRDELRWRGESAWALGWVLGRVEALAPDEFAPAGQHGLWPDLKKGEAALPYLQIVSTRPFTEVAAAADLHFRLHWAAIDASYLGEPFPFERYHPDLIAERRRALLWALSPGARWEDVDLSV